MRFPTHIKVKIENNYYVFDYNCTKELRILDPWSLVYIEENPAPKINIRYNISCEKPNTSKINSFIRRLSFLYYNNDSINDIRLFINNIEEELLSKKELYNRPKNEIIRENFDMARRKEKSTPGRLEKDLQEFIGGNSDKIDPKRFIKRLGIFGFDFYKMKKPYEVIREFPTGVFDKEIKNDTRILPTEYVDFVTFNKKDELSIIELKINDSKLEVISQILDYSLYFSAYKEDIINIIKKLDPNAPLPLKKGQIQCYVVNNYFHIHFDKISKYYSSNKPNPFKIQKITLGKTDEL